MQNTGRGALSRVFYTTANSWCNIKTVMEGIWH